MEAIIQRFEELLAQDDFRSLREGVRNLIDRFRRETERKENLLLNEYIREGNKADTFVKPENPHKEKFQSLLDAYGVQKEAYQAQQEIRKAERAEKEKQRQAKIKANVEIRKILVAEITPVVEASVNNIDNEMFDKMKDIQKRWNETGRIDSEEAKDLQASFSKQVESFYNNWQIFKDAREIEYERNEITKQGLLTKMEALADEESMPTVAGEMKKIQEAWKKSGPVTLANKESINSRFMELADIVYGRIKEFYDGRKDDERANLVAKIALCDEVNGVLQAEDADLKSHGFWQEATKTVLGIQKQWKSIGFAENNEEVWQAFRGVCDRFFDTKKDFYRSLDSVREENKKKKLALIKTAEGLQGDTNWDLTSRALINLQKDWKTIGAAARKDENQLWERFRGACDFFFAAKKEFYSDRTKGQDENLEKKQALIEEIKAFELSGENNADFESLKGFSAAFAQIGHVPYEQKDDVYKAYNTALDAQFSKLKLNKKEMASMKFESRLEGLMKSDDAGDAISKERRSIKSRINELKSDIAQYENNLGFFKHAKKNKPNPLRKAIENNINKLREEISELKQKMSMLSKAKIEKKVESTETEA